MLVFLQYLIAFMILQSADVSKRIDLYGIALTLVGFAAAARVVGVLLARRVGTGPEADARPLLTAFNVGRLAALAAFYVVAVSLGGAMLPAALGVVQWPLVPHVVQFVPFFALVGALAWGLHPAAAALRVGSTTAGRAALAEFREAVLPIAPIVLLVVYSDFRRLPAPDSAVRRAFDVLEMMPASNALVSLAAFFVVILVLPFVLRVVLRAKPLPAGPLRARLEAYSRRVGLRARDILVWPTGGDSLNAAVVGALPAFRYVFITDGLLSTLSEDEVEAVFAHEAGHARRGHILLFFGFTAVFVLVGVLPGLADVTAPLLARVPGFWRTIIVIVVWLGVVLGWISRRFEQEADVFGIETLPLSGADADPAQHPFARAMERIGQEVGSIREVTGWRHFSIADRVEFVRRYLTDPEVRRRHRRSLALLRGTMILVIAAFTVAAAARVPGEIRDVPAKWRDASDPNTLSLTLLHAALTAPESERRARGLFAAAACAAAAGRDEDSVRWLRESVALGRLDPRALVEYAAMLAKTGRPLGARLVWLELAQRTDLSQEDRDEAGKRAAGTEVR